MKFKLLLGSFLCALLTAFLWPVKTDYKNPEWYFYDQNNELIYTNTTNAFIPDEPIPPWLKEAVVALEDKQFYAHTGIDFRALARAALQNMESQKIVSGASTITMQVARLLYLTDKKRDYWYKLQQGFWALKLEQKLNKTDILEIYLQKVPLGQGTVGFAEASQRYFSKSITQLSIGEQALLLALLQNPSAFNPIDNPTAALKRRNLVLKRLHDAALISATDFEFWRSQPLRLNPQRNISITAPHYVFWLQQQLSDLAVENAVLKVYTTLDKSLYEDTLAIVRATIERQQLTQKITNAAVVVLNENNQITTMVGSPDYFNASINGSVNMATAFRQTGSVLKPFLFALALENGFSPATTLEDRLTIFPGGYWPRNFAVEEENGLVRFREALANSYNIAAVDLLNRVGVSGFHFFLQTFDLEIKQSAEELGYSIILGSAESSLLKVTTAFSAFKNKGVRVPPTAVLRVENQAGTIIYESPSRVSQKVVSSDTAEWIQQVLSDNEARWKNFSRGNSLELPFPSAAKTGTSQAFRDNWVVGFSPTHTVGVWAGNADGTPMVASSGIQGSGPIWQKVMQRVHQSKKPNSFAVQGNRVKTVICRRPEAAPCSEKVKAFLTAAEISALAEESAIPSSAEFNIRYPSAGDTFAAGSDLLIQFYPPTKTIKQYRFNNAEFTGPILKNLPAGEHSIELITLDGQSAIVQIQVEDL